MGGLGLRGLGLALALTFILIQPGTGQVAKVPTGTAWYLGDLYTDHNVLCKAYFEGGKDTKERREVFLRASEGTVPNDTSFDEMMVECCPSATPATCDRATKSILLTHHIYPPPGATTSGPGVGGKTDPAVGTTTVRTTGGDSAGTAIGFSDKVILLSFLVATKLYI